MGEKDRKLKAAARQRKADMEALTGEPYSYQTALNEVKAEYERGVRPGDNDLFFVVDFPRASSPEPIPAPPATAPACPATSTRTRSTAASDCSLTPPAPLAGAVAARSTRRDASRATMPPTTRTTSRSTRSSGTATPRNGAMNWRIPARRAGADAIGGPSRSMRRRPRRHTGS